MECQSTVTSKPLTLAPLLLLTGLYLVPQDAFPERKKALCQDMMSGPMPGGGELGLISSVITSVSTTTSSTTCITSSTTHNILTQKKLADFAETSWDSLRQEAASGCGEYMEALYDLYINALPLTQSGPDELTSERFCEIVRQDYEVIFGSSEYYEDFIPSLKRSVETALGMNTREKV